jgi:hypothetical protein
LYVDETDDVHASLIAEWEKVKAEWQEMEPVKPAKPLKPVKFRRSTKSTGDALEIER